MDRLTHGNETRQWWTISVVDAYDIVVIMLRDVEDDNIAVYCGKQGYIHDNQLGQSRSTQQQPK
jgi:hypothetical protein